MDISELKELGKVISVDKNGLHVRSHVDGYVYDIHFNDVVKFKNKGLDAVWQTKIKMAPSRLFKKFKTK